MTSGGNHDSSFDDELRCRGDRRGRFCRRRSLLAPVPASAQSGDPIKIGFSLALTGPLAPNGKQALLGAKIWQEEINAKGGLLGRKVELVNYDDQSNPANIPGIYTKLLDVDKVDLVNGPYGTNLVAPAMPVAMQKGKLFIGLFALDGNREFHYSRYFSMIPAGPKPRQVVHRRLLRGGGRAKAEAANRRAVAEDAEFARNACEGARENTKTYGFKIIYDKTFPPGTTDFSPIIRARAGGQRRPRRFVLLSAELGRHRAVGERTQFHAEDARRRHGRIAGDRIQGKAQDPSSTASSITKPGCRRRNCWRRLRRSSRSIRSARRPKASIRSAIISAAGATPISSCSARRSKAPRTLNDEKLADYLHSHEFTTIMADNVRFGENGEWTEVRASLQVQYHGITDAANLETWRGMSYQTVLTRPIRRPAS